MEYVILSATNHQRTVLICNYQDSPDHNVLLLGRKRHGYAKTTLSPESLQSLPAWEGTIMAYDKAKALAKQRRWRAKNVAHLKAYDAIRYSKNREQILARKAAEYAENPEKLRARGRAWYADDPERGKARTAAAYAKDPEKSKAINRKSYAKHCEKRKLKARLLSAANPENGRAFAKQRRARLANAPINDFTASQWKEMKEHYNHRCVYCKKKLPLTQDHVTPLSKGGSHTLSNIVPACKSCNSHKHTGPVLVPVQPLLLL